MQTVAVNASKAYDIFIGQGLLAQCGALLLDITKPCTIALITDDIVDPLYAQQAMQSLKNAGFTVHKLVLPHGEQHKTMETLGRIYGFLAENAITRSDILVALGGGVIGDTVGFAAATFLRGINFVQLPTTLLAAVDSSVGGKTGVNLPAGKNLAGAFWQPSLVICDTLCFNTLSPALLSDGMAEVVKYAVLCNPSLFAILENGQPQAQLESIVATCVGIKRDIVQQDEHDFGNRRLLNLGHTVGHAIEKCSGYQISHGQGVAIGMVIVTRAAETLGLCAPNCAQKVAALLTSLQLPTTCTYTAAQLSAVAKGDKKRSGDTISLILPQSIGQCFIYPILAENLEHFIEKGLC